MIRSSPIQPVENGPPLGVAVGTTRRRTLAPPWRIVAYGVAALAAARMVLLLDAREVGATLARAGAAALLALLPFGLEILLEVESWRLLLATLGRSVARPIAWRVTLVAEAVRLSLPGGPVVGDGLRPVLFERHGAVALNAGGSALAVRKVCQMATQGLLLLCGAATGSALLAQWASRIGPGGTLLRPAVALAGVGLMLGALLVAALLRCSPAARAEELLRRLAGPRLCAALDRRRAACSALDQGLRTLLERRPAVLLWNVLSAAAGWLLDVAETFLILRALGANLGWRDAVALEGLASVLRVLAFAVPGGLGIQDLGYYTLLRGLAGDGVAMGFVLLKRARDLFWMSTGYLLPLLLHRPAARAAPGRSPIDRAVPLGGAE